MGVTSRWPGARQGSKGLARHLFGWGRRRHACGGRSTSPRADQTSPGHTLLGSVHKRVFNAMACNDTLLDSVRKRVFNAMAYNDTWLMCCKSTRLDKGLGFWQQCASTSTHDKNAGLQARVACKLMSLPTNLRVVCFRHHAHKPSRLQERQAISGSAHCAAQLPTQCGVLLQKCQDALHLRHGQKWYSRAVTWHPVCGCKCAGGGSVCVFVSLCSVLREFCSGSTR